MAVMVGMKAKKQNVFTFKLGKSDLTSVCLIIVMHSELSTGLMFQEQCIQRGKNLAGMINAWNWELKILTHYGGGCCIIIMNYSTNLLISLRIKSFLFKLCCEIIHAPLYACSTNLWIFFRIKSFLFIKLCCRDIMYA